mmetsp:Transcript_22362/g.19270  ORF Transcript_22362/g.19270 Transcript_22362/m.19270 type:complete len:182 (+) Transcript_22362:559-1104(+)|eukprot:CAMPEP_0114581230 /NCGR_PEP_ID=MMETSP0125-20121206/5376_1 /TAXON_ID=485358 ORGANISM="Aristerostoma sp., Strain ATCC 50986" /NCGR_SAMPLE_ID=MMETSP0125 /ASSEMBLY_ACC=CAM_ASM_000245 /LENGTH=181 /DNA_ID=CAMNT_0001773305 /DNA_START=559 /DNA_END=1104 /DNA_ORIENTATION=+
MKSFQLVNICCSSSEEIKQNSESSVTQTLSPSQRNLSGKESANAKDKQIKSDEKPAKITSGDCWEVHHDRILALLCEKYHKNWKSISKKMSNYFMKKYHPHFLKFQYSKMMQKQMEEKTMRKYTKEEDEKLIEYAKEYKLDWMKISKHLPYKTVNSIRNRYYYLKRKQDIPIIGEEPGDMT